MSQNYLLFLIILFLVFFNTDAQSQSSVVRNVVMTSTFPNERFVATFEPPATPGGEIRQYRIDLVRRFGASVCDVTFILKCSGCNDTTVGSGGTLPSNCSNVVIDSFSKTDTTIRITSGDPNIPSATVYDVKFEARNAWGWGAPFTDKLTSGHYKSERVQNYNFTIIDKSTNLFYTTFQVPINENGKSAGYNLWVTSSTDDSKCIYGAFFNCTDCSGYTIGYQDSRDLKSCDKYILVNITESNKTVEYIDALPSNASTGEYNAGVAAQNGYGWGKIWTITFGAPSTTTTTPPSTATTTPPSTATTTHSYLSNLTLNTFTRKISFDGLYGNCSISYINIVLLGSECIYMVLNLSNRCNISSSNPIGQTIIPTKCTQVSVSVSFSGQSSYVYVPSSFNCAWPSYTLQLQDYTSKWSNPITTYTVGGVFILIIIIFLIAIVVVGVLIKYPKYMSDFLKIK